MHSQRARAARIERVPRAFPQSANLITETHRPTAGECHINLQHNIALSLADSRRMNYGATQPPSPSDIAAAQSDTRGIVWRPGTREIAFRHARAPWRVRRVSRRRPRSFGNPRCPTLELADRSERAIPDCFCLQLIERDNSCFYEELFTY